MLKERDYVIPEDVQSIFLDVCAHRLTMKPQAKISGVSAESVLRDILRIVKAPSLDRR
jgi:MoxR-like ATPase